ncbi:MAG TPA: glycerophosphodiester phosphodiesterase [Nocardioides sp.]|uniref:glycerophosphodiester phosphodiesterase n=1 Tax=Nocardioides sp. TaxID=35761 RepID=UPI002E351301|nr:glycerophosphodiester phosphodiesterase [Nocardioides sp.]HEX5088421.1 glycerophosphodiester phosphodiesterase [Nocardioides sp.]
MTLLAIAHRAGNSLAGLHAANLAGADVVECDVHAYRGRLEVRHLKTAGPLPFLWDRWELRSSSAPRLGLEELLAAGARGATFMLDLKGRRVATGRAVAQLLRDCAPDRDVLVCGRYWPSVDHVAELDFVRSVLSARNRAELTALRRRLSSASSPRPHGVSLHASLLRAPLTAWLHDRVQVVMTWPVDDATTLDRVLALGATGIITNEADVLRAVRARAT